MFKYQQCLPVIPRLSLSMRLITGVFITGTLMIAAPGFAQDTQSMKQVPTAELTLYGTLADQTPVHQATLTNSQGVEMDVISYGGIITRLETPDKNGQPGNIVLGMDSLEDYVSSNPYFGAIIGRYGNRIAKGAFTLNGTKYQLATNDGDNHLHGGVQGFDKKVWQMTPFTTENSAGVTLKLVSPDSDQGYPGTLDVTVTYTLTNTNSLDMQFSATTDKTTIVNLTQHSYFNLAGEGSILEHELMIPATQMTPVDGGLIPTGELTNVKGTPFDFTSPTPMGKNIGASDTQLTRGKGYDHNYVLKSQPDGELALAARVTDPKSGRTLTVKTTEPAVQFYSGNFLDGSTSQQGRKHNFRSGFCLEPQHSPDTPNQAGFPDVTLNPGETYFTRIVYEFGTEK